MDKNLKIAQEVLAAVGGKENIVNCMHCMTRLRLNLKDTGIVDLEKIKSLDVIGAQFSGEQLQIIIGKDINEVYDAFCELSGVQKKQQIDEQLDSVLTEKKKLTVKGVLNNVLDGIVGCVVPMIPILTGAGLIKALILIAQQMGWVSADSATVITLSFAADAAFYFMPVMIGGFAAKKFGANVALGAMLGAVLIHPTFVSMVGSGNALSVFGLPIYATSYSSTIIPAILSVWVMSYVEKMISKYSPKSLRIVLEPTLTLLIMIPLTLCALAPIGAMLSDGFANLLVLMYDKIGALAIAVFCAIVPFVIMTGMHLGTIPVALNSITATGVDKIVLPCFILANFTQGAACLGVGVKAKDAKLKSLAFSCAFSDLVPGISEPGLYGITLKYKTSMIAAMIGSFVGGLYIGLMNVGVYSFAAPNLFSLATFISETQSSIMHMVIGSVIAMIITFVMTMILYKETEENY